MQVSVYAARIVKLSHGVGEGHASPVALCLRLVGGQPCCAVECPCVFDGGERRSPEEPASATDGEHGDWDANASLMQRARNSKFTKRAIWPEESSTEPICEDAAMENRTQSDRIAASIQNSIRTASSRNAFGRSHDSVVARGAVESLGRHSVRIFWRDEQSEAPIIAPKTQWRRSCRHRGICRRSKFASPRPRRTKRMFGIQLAIAGPTQDRSAISFITAANA